MRTHTPQTTDTNVSLIVYRREHYDRTDIVTSLPHPGKPRFFIDLSRERKVSFGR